MNSETSYRKENFIDSTFIIWWSIANAVGLACSLGILSATGMPTRGFVWFLILLSIMGSIFGTAQAVVLKSKIDGDQWVGFSVIGWLIGAWLGVNVGAFFGGWMGTAVLGIILGASLGIAQLFILNKYIVSPEWWVIVSGVGVSVGLLIGLLVAGVLSIFLGGIAWLFGLLIAGAIYGVLTGLFLKAQIVE